MYTNRLSFTDDDSDLYLYKFRYQQVVGKLFEGLVDWKKLTYATIQVSYSLQGDRCGAFHISMDGQGGSHFARSCQNQKTQNIDLLH